MTRALKILALLLPVVIPALLAGKIMVERSTAPVYLVRIEGYDPRDMLYGHYLMFRFTPEKSDAVKSFPDDMSKRLEVFDGRYYIPEDKAYTLDTLLRDQERVMAIEVGLPEHGKAFMRDLYIDGKKMPDFLAEFEDRVDFNGDPEGQ